MCNRNYDLYRIIIKYSLHNGNTTLGENVRYFMHKNNIAITEWLEKSIHCIKKFKYVKYNFDAECYYVGTTIRELCEARDNGCPQFLECSDILLMIDLLCTN